MPNKAHRDSQALSVAAEVLLKDGFEEEARSLYLRAARLESTALNQIYPDKARTRRSLAVSMVSQYYKDAAYLEAEPSARRLLDQSDLPTFVRDQLQHLLNHIPSTVGPATGQGLNVT